MRRDLSVALLASLIIGSACQRDEPLGPHGASFASSAQVVDASTSRIAFASTRDGNYEIYVMNADGSATTRLTNNSARDDDPSWSPDGRRIAFRSTRDGNSEIYVMGANGSAPTRLTNNPALDDEPSWSPDGQRIAFVSFRDGTLDIYVMNADGSAPTRLTTGGSYGSPSWSPDGQRIAFHGSPAGSAQIRVMNADGSNQTQLTAPGSPDPEVGPRWSPDGREIAFVRFRDYNLDIYVMNADGSAPRQLTNGFPDDFDPSWSPDGQQIAFTSTRDNANFEIYMMGADGSAPTRLTANPATDVQPSWSPRVQDETPPTLTLPGPISVSAARWFGSVVRYAGSVSATDDFDPHPNISCSPASGSTFPIGTNQVDCTATDLAGNTTTGSFLVSVRGPYEELGLVAGSIRQLIAGNPRQNLATARLEDVLTEVEAAREEFARTPPDRPEALGQLQGAAGDFVAAVKEGELSQFGYNVLVPWTVGAARLAADQAIAEAVARGESADAIATAQQTFAEGDSQRATGQFKEAIAQYKKACIAVNRA